MLRVRQRLRRGLDWKEGEDRQCGKGRRRKGRRRMDGVRILGEGKGERKGVVWL